MPRGRPKGYEVPAGYLSIREAAERLGCSRGQVAMLIRAGILPSVAGPKHTRHAAKFVPVAAVETYRLQHPVRHPSQALSSNGHARTSPKPTVPRVGAVPQPPLPLSPGKLWATLERLEGHKREVWDELQAGGSAAVRDEWYLLLRRLLFAELALLEELFAEPEAEKPEAIDYFGEGEDEDG